MKTVILCGGSGTRLWPISTDKTPKQYIKLFEDQSLFTKTLERNSTEGLMVISNKNHLDLLKEQTPNHTQFILEEIGRNTAPAICFAALNANPEDILLILPSDHLINKIEEYKTVLKKAEELAQKDNLVTFGIKPTHPETGYGYIEADGNIVLSFKEKPDFHTAEEYIDCGNYYWNSGMFCFKAKVFLEELEKHSKDILDSCKAVYSKLNSDSKEITLPKDKLLTIRSESIDYAVMEKSDRVKVVKADIGWSDLGSFDSLYEAYEKDQNGNATKANYQQIDSKNNLIISENSQKIIATYDVSDLIIIDTEDGLLVGKRGSTQRVKEIYNLIKK
jgi:mannose-1-phosphate guanylyltransferase